MQHYHYNNWFKADCAQARLFMLSDVLLIVVVSCCFWARPRILSGCILHLFYTYFTLGSPFGSSLGFSLGRSFGMCFGANQLVVLLARKRGLVSPQPALTLYKASFSERRHFRRLHFCIMRLLLHRESWRRIGSELSEIAQSPPKSRQRARGHHQTQGLWQQMYRAST